METCELKKIAEDLRLCLKETPAQPIVEKKAEVITQDKQLDVESTREFMKLAHEQGFSFEEVTKFLGKTV